MSSIRITILSGYASPKTLEFEGDQGEIRIGRAPDAEVRLDPTRDTAVSRGVHARLVRDNEDGWQLECLHAGGVGVVGQGERVVRRLDEGEKTPVLDGLTFEIGTNGPRLNASDPSVPLPVTNIKNTSGVVLPHVPQDVIGKARSSARWLKVVMPVGLIAVIGVTIGVIMVNTASQKRDSSQDVAISGTQQATEELRKQVVLQEVGINEARALLAHSQEAIDGLRNMAEQTQTQVAGIAKEIQSDFAAILQEASRSVVLVGIVDQEGDFSMIGTAWVVGSKRLATNAHVAFGLDQSLNELAQGSAGSPGLKTVARLPGKPARDIEVVGSQVHPGYEEFAHFMRPQLVDYRRGMFARNLPGDQFELVAFGDPYDVAFLDLKEDIGPSLAMADESELRMLRPGEEIAYIGFPSEGVLYTMVDSPATMQVGRLTNLTNVFSQVAEFEECLLLHHSLPTVGGASGSPIFNRSGKVVGVVSHGSVQMTKTDSGDPARLMIGFNFGQRITMLRELLDGTAGSPNRQAARHAEWTKELADVKPIDPKDRSFLRARLAAVDRFGDLVAANPDLRNLQLNLVNSVIGPIGAKTAVAHGEVSLERGTYIVAAAGQDIADFRLSIQVNQDPPMVSEETNASVESIALVLTQTSGLALMSIDLEYYVATPDTDFVSILVFRVE